MTRVQFYYDTPDPLGLLWEFVSGAYAKGRKIAIRTASEQQARQIDQMLWTRQSQSFIPHVETASPLAERTPVTIGTAAEQNWPNADLIFNLATDTPPQAEVFRMVIEIVGHAEAEKIPARGRWKWYKEKGFPIRSFDSRTRTAL